MNTRKGIIQTLGIALLVIVVMGLTVSPSFAWNAQRDGGPLENGYAAALPVKAPEGGSPVPGGPGYVAVNALEFHPKSSNATFGYMENFLYNTDAGNTYFTAPVHLPQGAKVNQLVLFYLDTDNVFGHDVQLSLLYCNDFLSICETMTDMSPTDTTATVGYATTTTILNTVVNNALYSYILQVYLPASANISIGSVRVDYTYDSALPLVMK